MMTRRRIDVATLTTLVIGLALGTLPLLAEVPVWLWPAPLLLAGWRLHLARHHAPAPPSRVRAAVGLGLTASLVLTRHIGLGIEEALPLFVTFLWLKVLETENQRDVGMAAVLGSFLAGAGVLLDQSLARMALALATVLVVWTAVAMEHLPAAPGRFKRCLRLLGTLGLQATPLAAVLFLLVPRPPPAFPIDRGHARTGVSDQISPGSIEQLAKDQSTAFRVAFTQGAPSDVQELYWRGPVMAATDGIVWSRDTRRVGLGLPPRPPANGNDPVVEQDITLLPHQQSWIYALDMPTDPGKEASFGTGTTLVRNRPVSSPLTYHVTSHTQREACDGDFAALARWSNPPDQLDQRVPELARELQRRAGGTRASLDQLIAATLDWMRDQGFVYTLQPGTLSGDPTATFLFERKAGFCSHYATSFATLMRLCRRPARVVAGYRGGEWNELGDFLVVRQSHAHAWCEVFDQDTGSWRRVDPTIVATGERTAEIASQGGSAVDDPGSNGTWRSMRKWWDVADARWQNWMYRFDSDVQSRLGERLGLGSLGSFGLLLGAVLAATAALVGIAWLLRGRRTASDPAQRLYRAWQRRLARAGCVAEAHEAPLAFAVRAAAVFPHQQADIDAITAAYCAARYGSGDLAHLRQALAAAGTARDPR